MNTPFLEIEIPLFIERFRLAEKKRATFYRHGDEVPNKYTGKGYWWIKKSGWKEERLCRISGLDKRTRPIYEMVIKNSASAGKPRWQMINGNDVWAKMDEHVRMKMILEMSKSFAEHVAPHTEALTRMKFPVLMEADMYTTPKACDWDMSNQWVYAKVFEDYLQYTKMLPNDNILYITKPATGARFIPITLREQRKLVFKFYEDFDLRICSHLMYNRGPKELVHTSDMRVTTGQMHLVITKQGESGSLLTDLNANVFSANVGKKQILPGKFVKMLDRIYSDCINLNQGIWIEHHEYIKYESYLNRLLEKGIPIYAYHEQGVQ